MGSFQHRVAGNTTVLFSFITRLHKQTLCNLDPTRETLLTYSHQLDERHGEVVLIRHVRLRALLVDAAQREAEQRQQRRDGETEVELQEAGQLRPRLYLQEEMERTRIVKILVIQLSPTLAR